MVRIGDIYVDPAAIQAVSPQMEGPGYAVFLSSGRIMYADVREAEMLFALEAAGLLAAERVSVSLTEVEEDELRTLYARGYTYLARDMDGKVFAYRELPELVGGYWEDRGDTNTYVGATAGAYAFLAPGAECEPVKIMTLLGGT